MTSKKMISYFALAFASVAAHGVAHAAADAAPEGAADTSDIIVTGTRTTGMKAADSAAPIKIIGTDAIGHVGQPNLNQVLSQLVPSFTTESVGGDTANLTLSARLRGLSPNHTLVLVNGKRRHSTANLHVLGGQFQGGAAPDLDLIPPSAIERIEVLEDGAAAQYGSDAIAGVINIILKSNSEGGMVQATAGQYYKGDGETYSATGNLGFKVGESGFVNLTLFHRFHDYSDRGGADARASNPDGSIRTDLNKDPALNTALQQAYLAIPGYPHINHINGDSRSYLSTINFNAGYDFGDVQFYSFGGYSHRSASSFENFRMPDRVKASPVLGVTGTFITPGELIFAPQGFNPREGLVEDDYAITGGFKGVLAGWNWDISTTYGADHDDIHTYDSANASLFVDTHFTPTNFYDGTFKNSEWTNNLDISRDFDIGLAKPLNVALGFEHRRDSYQIKQGDPASIYKEGGQSYPGFQPTDAGTHGRTNISAYIDIAVNPIEALHLDGAVRYEHYTDFGSKVIEKLTGRYDFSPAFALRGTVSTGFRAPTLAEEYYSATNVSPSLAIVQLPANSAAAKLLGFGNLKPEKSTNFSAGFVAHPASRLTLTLDAYQIKIRDRVTGTGTIYGGVQGVTYSQAVIDAIDAHGNVLDPNVGFVGVSAFTNGLDTRTRGIEGTATYMMPLGELGRIDWMLSGNYNETKITKIRATPASILPQQLFDKTALSTIETGSPKYKIVLNALYTYERFSLNLRETVYGPTSAYYNPPGGVYTKNTVPAAGITDIEVDYKLTDFLDVAFGANNVFNANPPGVLLIPGTHTISNGGNIYDTPLGLSPYGINGGYYYGRLTAHF